MGADTARHYEWYPWINHGHDAVWRVGGPARGKRQMAALLPRRDSSAWSRARTTASASASRSSGARTTSCRAFATQALLYRRMTGDTRFREYEAAALDWLFGANPWGTSMVDRAAVVRHVAARPALRRCRSRSALRRSSAGWSTARSTARSTRTCAASTCSIPTSTPRSTPGSSSTTTTWATTRRNEPIMDGTAMLTYLLAAMAP